MTCTQYMIGFIFAIIFCVHRGNAISCYQCNSYNDTRCETEHLLDDFKITCPAEDIYTKKPNVLCRKIKQIIEFEVNHLKPNTRIIRRCGWDDSSYKDACYLRSGFGGRQQVCACSGDFCNGSNGLLTSTVSLIFILVTLKIAL